MKLVTHSNLLSQWYWSIRLPSGLCLAGGRRDGLQAQPPLRNERSPAREVEASRRAGVTIY